MAGPTRAAWARRRVRAPAPADRAARAPPRSIRPLASGSGYGVLSRRVEQELLRVLEAALRIRRRAADRGQADPSELVQRAEHVEDDAAAVGGEARERGQAQQPAVAERAQARGLQMVRGDVVARRAARGGEGRGVGVVDAAREQLQRRQRMGRPAAAQVDLDRVRLPAAVGVAGDDVVDPRTPPRAGVEQCSADLARALGDRAGVRGLGREAAAEVALAGQDLVVRGDDPRVGAQLELDARAAQLGAGDPLLDDPAVREPLEVEVQARRRPPAPSRRSARRAGRSVAPRRSISALPSPETPASSLRTTSCQLRLERPQTGDRGDRLGAARDALDPERVLDARAGEELT